MDIEGWRRSLGLERYEAAFRDNEIDDTILPKLTAEDLKELGVGPVGHRRKLLDAIAALRADSNANAPLPAPSPTAPAIAARATPLIVEAVANAATSQLCSATWCIPCSWRQGAASALSQHLSQTARVDIKNEAPHRNVFRNPGMRPDHLDLVLGLLLRILEGKEAHRGGCCVSSLLGEFGV